MSYFPSKPTKNFGVGYTPGNLKLNKRKRVGTSAFRKESGITLSRIKGDIMDVDSEISQQVGQMQQRLRRQPTESEVRLNPKINRLLTERDNLLANYQQILQQHKFYKDDFNKMASMNVIKETRQNFAGIKRKNPFREFKRTPLRVPAVTPQHRLIKDARKSGTLWDPTFTLTDVSVNPKIKNFYKRYLR